MRRFAFAFATFIAILPSTAWSQSAPKLQWPDWMWQRGLKYCDKSRLLDAQAIAGRINIGAGTLENAVAQVAGQIPQMAARQKECLIKDMKGQGPFGNSGSLSAGEKADLERAANDSEANLHQYLMASKAHFLSNVKVYWEYSINIASYAERLQNSLSGIRIVSKRFNGFVETCGAFDFSVRPLTGDASAKAKIDARRSCVAPYARLKYPGGDRDERHDREGISFEQASRERSQDYDFQFKAFKCTGKRGGACWDAEIMKMSHAVDSFRTAKHKLAAFSPYVCSRHGEPSCVPDKDFQRIAAIATDANTKLMIDWDTRFERERALAKAELKQLDDYEYLWKWGVTYEELMAGSKSR